jgi:hypothetical protein
MQMAMISLALVCVLGGLLLLPALRGAFLHQAAQVLTEGTEFIQRWGGV